MVLEVSTTLQLQQAHGLLILQCACEGQTLVAKSLIILLGNIFEFHMHLISF